MTEDDVRALIVARVSRETWDQLCLYVAALERAAARQNLISPASIAQLWSRHILDSVQLAWLCAAITPLLDVGSGAGLPGLVLSILLPGPVTLVEPRALRASFLRDTVEMLGLAERVTVVQARVERLAAPPYATITARAVAGLDALLAMAAPCADAATRWILPRGRSAAADVAAARRLWHGRFEMMPSMTESTAAIVIADDVRRRANPAR